MTTPTCEHCDMAHGGHRAVCPNHPGNATQTPTAITRQQFIGAKLVSCYLEDCHIHGGQVCNSNLNSVNIRDSKPEMVNTITTPAAPAESVTELCANHDNLREYISQLERERDEAKVRAIEAWKDADAAILKEVESRVASIMGSPDNEIARLTASRNVFRDERDALQAERNTLRSQLAHARSRGDDKEIAEKERDAARAELAAVRAGTVSDEMVDRAIIGYAGRETYDRIVASEPLTLRDLRRDMRAALEAIKP